MPPEIDYLQFSGEELNKLIEAGEGKAGYTPFQQAISVQMARNSEGNFIKDNPDIFIENTTKNELQLMQDVLGNERVIETKEAKG